MLRGMTFRNRKTSTKSWANDGAKDQRTPRQISYSEAKISPDQMPYQIKPVPERIMSDWGKLESGFTTEAQRPRRECSYDPVASDGWIINDAPFQGFASIMVLKGKQAIYLAASCRQINECFLSVLCASVVNKYFYKTDRDKKSITFEDTYFSLRFFCLLPSRMEANIFLTHLILV